MSAPTGGETPDYDDALPGAQTELAPSADETAASTAWALDDGPEWKPPFWTSGRITGVAAVSAGILIAAAAVLGTLYLHDRDDRQDAVVATPTSTVVPLPPPPPVTVTTVIQPPVTVTAPAVTKQIAAPAPPPAPRYNNMRGYDNQMLSRLVANGWYITDAELLTVQAHQICEEFAMGTSLQGVRDKLRGGYSADDAVAFTAIVQMTYPDCVPNY